MSASALFGSDGKILGQYIPTASSGASSGVYLTQLVNFSKSTDASAIPQTAFTVPEGYAGYYQYTVSCIMTVTSAIEDGDNITFYMDDTGNVLGPAGDVNLIRMNKDTGNDLYNITYTGFIMASLPVGMTIQLSHKEEGDFTFDGDESEIKVAYTYLGDNVLPQP
jgi:hypothetical protein